MFAKLKGNVDAIGESDAVIDVGGVGYLVGMGGRSLARLEPGQAVEIHIETQVREDLIRLWGFLSERERAWFQHLQQIQGVGSKAAIAVLDALGAADLESAAILGDSSAFARAKGVGPKLAQRLAAELKDKPPPRGRSYAADFKAMDEAMKSAPRAAAQAGEDGGHGGAREDAVSALLNLGYGESEARKGVAAAGRALGSDAKEGDLIRAALKELAR
ncbi:Holliday junction branch migration protein RuvA [Hyphobacterium sp. SN044]|uniref:Holliday junction branch migration protein RuvA n=1 Tax=Hyphobacterium sp. SN044 TaxID=2912575 RepID=UPI001F02A4F1|nr:Holliday junction branch migration protein RuvA [Hyphobacterium sp. SN044]MCF8879873.1 Holliday junction branch migration protein RuvA [Hyphobacterium sp. SN044]